MAIDNTNVIDAVGVDTDGQVLLTIVDHLEWDEDNEHLLMLQDKINAYLSSIESGELVENYPDAKDKKICINLMYKFTPHETGKEFLYRVEQTLKSSGYNFTHRSIEM